MQVELTNLQPELIKTSEETDKIMVKIEHDSIEVEAKKEVSGNESRCPISADFILNIQYHRMK